MGNDELRKGREREKEMSMSKFHLSLTWRGTQVEHRATLVQDPKLTVELNELEGRTRAVAVVAEVFFFGGERRDEFFWLLGHRFR